MTVPKTTDSPTSVPEEEKRSISQRFCTIHFSHRTPSFRAEQADASAHFLKIFSIALPLANSSTSLSR